MTNERGNEETQAIRILRNVTGLDESAARRVLRDQGSNPSKPAMVRNALASALAGTWSSDPTLVIRRLLPTTSLDRPRRSLFRAPTTEDIVRPDDWRDLVDERWLLLPLWQERDWAVWLNGLIRRRTEVQADAPTRMRRASMDPGRLSDYARTLFYAGR